MLYVDMDGVLADFDSHYEATFNELSPKKAFGENKLMTKEQWKKIRNTPNFFYNIPPMKDMFVLWNYVKKYNPTVLTGIPDEKTVREAALNKREWITKHLGNDVKVICCKSALKCAYANPGDILIDDWVKYKQNWLDAGGIWIPHTSAENSIQELKKYYV